MSTQKISAGQHEFSGWQEAQEYHLENGLTDGLPIIPPTAERVRAMLDYVGLAADSVIGVEATRQKRFTAEKVAINAVMAGCQPEYFPALVAAISAVGEREFTAARRTSGSGDLKISLCQRGIRVLLRGASGDSATARLTLRPAEGVSRELFAVRTR